MLRAVFDDLDNSAEIVDVPRLADDKDEFRRLTEVYHQLASIQQRLKVHHLECLCKARKDVMEASVQSYRQCWRIDCVTILGCNLREVKKTSKSKFNSVLISLTKQAGEYGKDAFMVVVNYLFA